MNHFDVFCPVCGVPAGEKCTNTLTGAPSTIGGQRYTHLGRSAYDWVSRKSPTLHGPLLASKAESRL